MQADWFSRQSNQRRVFFLLTFIGLIVLSFLLIRPFLNTLVVALIVALMLKPVYNRVAEWRWVGSRPPLAAGVTLAGFLLLVIVPLALLIWFAIQQLGVLAADIAAQDLEATAQEIVETLESLPLPGLIFDSVEALAAFRDER